jgi:hypothetical protein
VLVSLVYVVACRLFALVVLLARSDHSNELEILLLRHELSILRRQARRPKLTESDRLVLAALSRVLPRRSWQTFLVTPETLVRWHRRIIARRSTYPHKRPGRPPVDAAVRQLIVRLARENSHWGYVRIVGDAARHAFAGAIAATCPTKSLLRGHHGCLNRRALDPFPSERRSPPQLTAAPPCRRFQSVRTEPAAVRRNSSTSRDGSRFRGSHRNRCGAFSCYVHSSGPGAVMMWFSDPGGRKKVE